MQRTLLCASYVVPFIDPRTALHSYLRAYFHIDYHRYLKKLESSLERPFTTDIIAKNHSLFCKRYHTCRRLIYSRLELECGRTTRQKPRTSNGYGFIWRARMSYSILVQNIKFCSYWNRNTSLRIIHPNKSIFALLKVLPNIMDQSICVSTLTFETMKLSAKSSFIPYKYKELLTILWSYGFSLYTKRRNNPTVPREYNVAVTL